MASCPNSYSLQVPTIHKSGDQVGYLTPTLRSRSPCSGCGDTRRSKSTSRSFLQLPRTNQTGRCLSPSSPNNTNDRLIPNRSKTDLELASHLLSPLSQPYKIEQVPSAASAAIRAAAVAVDDTDDTHFKHVPRILNFGAKGNASFRSKRPLTLVAKPKLKIPTKPDRVMAAPGTFLEYGFQSTHWSPSSMIVVALESGVYVCKINDDCNVVEIQNNSDDPDNPFCHVLWNAAGNSVVCAKFNGKIQICDLRHKVDVVPWQLNAKHTLRSIALEQEHLLTCGTMGNGVQIYDNRQSGENAKAIWSLKNKRDVRSSVNSLAWSPSGHLLACGCESGLIYLWDVRHHTKQMSVITSQEKNPVQVLSWCSWKSSVLFSGSSFPRPSICAQNVATGIQLGQVDCVSEVTGIQFNPQLKQVATSHHTLFHAIENNTVYGSDSSVQLWQFSSNNRLNPLLQLGQHEEGIVSMAASENSNQLLTMGGDELLCIWQWSGNNPASLKTGSQSPRSVLEFSSLIR